MHKRIKITIYLVCTLWIVVFAQILITRVYVRKNDVTQAFARNQLAIQEQSFKGNIISTEGGWIMGTVAGRLSQEEKRKMAESIFNYEGGGGLDEHSEDGFYVAYGFSSGIDVTREINGRRINMNVAITYDETEDKTIVYFGVPILFDNF